MTKAVAMKDEKKKKSLQKVQMKPEKTPKKEKIQNAVAKTPEAIIQKGTPKSIKKQNAINMKGKKENLNNSSAQNTPPPKKVSKLLLLINN